MSEPLLRVEHLCQYFGPNKAVDDVSFEIQKGEVFGLVGESGCGKTTTGRSIIKLYSITSGSIYFKGKRIAAGTKSYRDRIREARKESRDASPERRSELEAEIKERLLSGSRSDDPEEEVPAAAGKAVSISADDFED